MCGRYQFDDGGSAEEIHKILDEINAKYKDRAYKTGEIFPTDSAPILTAKNGKFKLELMRWGFPKWDGKGEIINARSETAAEKASFKKPLHEKRCVVLSTGFYEWQKKDALKTKNKYLFNVSETPMLYMAGLYSTYKSKGCYSDSFVILTRRANGSISDIHDRMPVILSKSDIPRWLLDERFTDTAFNKDNIYLVRTPV